MTGGPLSSPRYGDPFEYGPALVRMIAGVLA